MSEEMWRLCEASVCRVDAHEKNSEIKAATNGHVCKNPLTRLRPPLASIFSCFSLSPQGSTRLELIVLLWVRLDVSEQC